jgi:hypothetical protein
MIYLFPSAQIVIHHDRSPDDFIAQLAQMVEPNRFLRWAYSDTLQFEGTVKTNEFEVRRINSWSSVTGVVADGQVRPAIAGQGSEVTLLFSIDKRYFLKLIIMLLILAVTRRKELLDPVLRWGALVFLLAAFGIYLVILMIIFNLEVRRIRKIMEEL